jgi:hypothetical protein
MSVGCAVAAPAISVAARARRTGARMDSPISK